MPACPRSRTVDRITRLAAIAATMALAACLPRPLDVQVQDADSGAPIEGVSMHKHAVSLLTLLPSRQDPVKSQADGSARVWVPPLNTNITLLRPGYEPASVAIFRREVPASMRGSSAAPRLLFDELKDGRVVELKMKACVRVPVQVTVVDAETGAPLPGARVLARTFLYLPAPGLEEGWGFPDLQDVPTDAAGHAKIDRISGFRNRISARMPGRADAHADLRGDESRDITLRLRELRWKAVRFEVLDEKRGTPVEGAWVALEEPRAGLPADPNAFAACTGADGLTPPMPVPDEIPLVLQVLAPGHHDRREALDWSRVGDGDTRTIWVRRRGWFE